MDLTYLSNYIMPVALGVCLCVGYILKNLVPTEKINRYIPLIMGVLGLAIVAWTSHAFTPDVVLTGLISGLASTGAYEMFTNLINKK